MHCLKKKLSRSKNMLEAVFQMNSTGIPDVKIWNHIGILTEFYWNTGGILPPILSKLTAFFLELF